MLEHLSPQILLVLVAGAMLVGFVLGYWVKPDKSLQANSDDYVSEETLKHILRLDYKGVKLA